MNSQVRRSVFMRGVSAYIACMGKDTFGDMNNAGEAARSLSDEACLCVFQLFAHGFPGFHGYVFREGVTVFENGTGCHELFVSVDEILQRTDYFCRRSRRDSVGGYVSRYGAVGSYDGVVANSDVGEDDAFNAHENVVANGHVAYFRVSQMLIGAGVVSQNVHSRGQCDVVAYVDVPHV